MAESKLLAMAGQAGHPLNLPEGNVLASGGGGCNGYR